MLDLLESAGIEFVILHHEELIGTSDLSSDVDIALGTPISKAIEAIRPDLASERIIVALIWAYDVGGGASVFFTNQDGSAGAQIDILHDPRGSGRYGLRSGHIVASRRPGLRYDVPNRLDQLLYLLCKSSLKGREARVAEHVRELTDAFTSEMIGDRVEQLFSRSIGHALRILVAGGDRRPMFRPIRWILSLVRIGGRLRRPIGYWVEISGPMAVAQGNAESLVERFGRWLVRSESGRRPYSVARYYWWLTRVVPVRLRPGIFVSWSEGSTERLRADLVLPASESPDDLAELVIAAMAGRAFE